MVPRLLCCILVLACCLAPTFLVQADSLYVKQSVPSSGDGGSWETAFKTIKEGINAARNGDEVIVAEGTYAETVDFIGKDITVRSTKEDDPRVVASTVIQASGSPEVVRFRSSESRNAIIAGFTITLGQVGVSCVWSSPVVRNNMIQANTADFDKGGGISCYYGSPLIENNMIALNLAYRGGAGIACEGAKPVIIGNLILDNRTDAEGGGILCVDCAPTIARNRIIANVCQGNGGGISSRGSQVQVINNLIVSNRANSTGGAIACYNSVARIAAHTIANNSVPGSGAGGLRFLDSSGEVVNCILWGNGEEISGSKATFSCIEESGAEVGGDGNIHEAPGFLDPDGPDDLLGTEDDDYRLSAGSPCIDRGSFSAAARLSVEKRIAELVLSWEPGEDLLGQPRISGFGPDMGCYEHQSGLPSYAVECSPDMREWSPIHAGGDTCLLLSPMPPGRNAFFRVSLSLPRR